MTKRRMAIAWAIGLGVSASAADLTLDRRAIEEAIAIGQSRIDTTRTRFHAAYRVLVGVAPVDYIEIITPFRRIALAAEAKARAGDRLFGLGEAQQILAQSPDELALYIELTFHPLNTFVTVPPYDVVLMSGGAVVPPRRIDRVPRFGPRLEGYPLRTSPSGGGLILPGGQPLTGATLIAGFDLARMDPRGAYAVNVKDGPRTLAQARIDLSRLR